MLFQVIVEAIEDYKKVDRNEWVKKWAGQAVLCVSQLYWTTDVHEALRTGGDALSKYTDQNTDQVLYD